MTERRGRRNESEITILNMREGEDRHTAVLPFNSILVQAGAQDSFFPKNLSMMRAMNPSPVTLQAVPKLSMAM